jgi:predicted O-methyltransferase YrrM
VRIRLKSRIKRFAARILDLLLVPLLVVAAVPMKLFRAIGPQFAPASRALLRSVGVWPLRRHYYDPLFHPADLSRSLTSARSLAGIEWRLEEQREILGRMRYGAEFNHYLLTAPEDHRKFTLENDTFASGDADYLYGLIRLVKPRRVIEVGCGNSTRVMRAAEIKNQSENPQHRCVHVCVEPYENPWLEDLGVQVLRQRVETLSLDQFGALEHGDLLFIDSSHIARPNGDVTFEILEVLPVLKPGVLVHFHDIFSPRDYPAEWIEKRVYQWNEQYILEAFLSFNSEFEIFGALNLLHHQHYAELAAICVRHDRSREPGSFYIQRRVP